MKNLCAVVAVGLLLCLCGCADTRATLEKTPDSLALNWLNQKDFTADDVDITAPDGFHAHIGHLTNNPNDVNRTIWAGMAKINADSQETIRQMAPAVAGEIVKNAKP